MIHQYDHILPVAPSVGTDPSHARTTHTQVPKPAPRARMNYRNLYRNALACMSKP